MTECNDKNCPEHGNLSVRGRQFTAKVVSAKMKRSAVVKVTRVRKVPKYDRYEKRSSRISVHKPDCIAVKEGDQVTVGECRPISKTKSFVIIKKEEVEKSTPKKE